MPKQTDSGAVEKKVKAEKPRLRAFFFPDTANGTTVHAASREEAEKILADRKAAPKSPEAEKADK